MSDLFFAAGLRERLSSSAGRLHVLLSVIRSAVVSPNEEQRLLTLSEGLGALDEWLTPTGSLRDAWTTKEGSELAEDDALAKPYTLSPAIWAAATAAVSHLACLRDALSRVRDAQDERVYAHGHIALARGAIENASLAFWLLEPEDSAQRILRRLQADWRARQRAALRLPPSTTMDDRFVRLSAVADTVRVDPGRIRQGPSEAEIVRSAGKHQIGGPDLATFIWTACGAAAHGQSRDPSAHLPEDVPDTASPDRRVYRPKGNLGLLVDGGLLAVGITRAALDLYARRAGPSW